MTVEIRSGEAPGPDEKIGQCAPDAIVDIDDLAEGFEEELCRRAMEILGQLTALVAPHSFQRSGTVGTWRADRQCLAMFATTKEAAERYRAGGLEFFAHFALPLARLCRPIRHAGEKARTSAPSAVLQTACGRQAAAETRSRVRRPDRPRLQRSRHWRANRRRAP